jgi:hypothetical protein
MKTIASSISGLASSLLLNVGLNQIAQKLDPVSHGRFEHCACAHGAAFSTVPCEFPKKQQD